MLSICHVLSFTAEIRKKAELDLWPQAVLKAEQSSGGQHCGGYSIGTDRRAAMSENQKLIESQ